MKVDGALMVDDPRDAGPAGRRLEEVGYAGAFTFEGRHDPFLPLLCAAEQTERIELITAIAVGFARSPLSLAYTAYDLQLASRGRFILGLGTQIRAHVERRYGAAWGRPVARMRELVGALRAIFACWQDGAKLDFRGDYYTHTLMTPVFEPGPNPHGMPRIFLAGVGPRMTALSAEIADGYLVHPFHTEASLAQVTLPALRSGLERAGRERDAIEVSCQVILAIGETDQERERAIAGARAQISFYASTPAYRPVLDCLGLGALQDELRELSKRGEWLAMAGRIDDGLIERVAVVARPADAAAAIRARYGDLADRVSLIAPFAPDAGQWAGVVADLAD
jgi:probable F420-dependent oxidoreductase